jgi:hypothetical protein
MAPYSEERNMKKITKKLTLNKETVANLKQVNGGLLMQDKQVASGGPEICWFSDCNPCD